MYIVAFYIEVSSLCLKIRYNRYLVKSRFECTVCSDFPDATKDILGSAGCEYIISNTFLGGVKLEMAIFTLCKKCSQPGLYTFGIQILYQRIPRDILDSANDHCTTSNV